MYSRTSAVWPLVLALLLTLPAVGSAQDSPAEHAPETSKSETESGESEEGEKEGRNRRSQSIELIGFDFYRGEKFNRRARLEDDEFELGPERGLKFSLEVSLDVFRVGRVTVTARIEPEETGPDIEREAEYELDSEGVARIGFPGLVNLSQFGDDWQDAELELTVEGERGERFTETRDLRLRGPRPPLLKVNEIFVIPDSGGASPLLEPGEDFTVHVFYEVRRNEARVTPEMDLFAVVDRNDFDPTVVHEAGNFQATIDLPSRPGIYEIKLNGRAPNYFHKSRRSLHELNVLTAIWLGDDEPSVREERRTIYDQFPGPRNREPDNELDARVWLDDEWEIDEIDEDSYFDRLDELQEVEEEMNKQRRFEARFDRFD